MQGNQPKNSSKQGKEKQNKFFEVIDTDLQSKKTCFSLGKPLLFLLMTLLLFTFTILFSKRTFEEVVIYDKEGKPQLAPERLEKLKEDTTSVNKCHQYSLFATKSDWYPCYTCMDTSFVFLLRGEVWRYGKHCPKDRPRYSDDLLKSMKLKYKIEFKGNLLQCTKMEKQKIYTYPLLPENLKRKKPLGHPAGNKNDN